MYDLDEAICSAGLAYAGENSVLSNRDAYRISRREDSSDHLNFNSQFECGNLRKVIQVSHCAKRLVRSSQLPTHSLSAVTSGKLFRSVIVQSASSDHLNFNSQFECGNLRKVIQVSHCAKRLVRSSQLPTHSLSAVTSGKLFRSVIVQSASSDHLNFNSQFECGNLRKVIQVSHCAKRLVRSSQLPTHSLSAVTSGKLFRSVIVQSASSDHLNFNSQFECGNLRKVIQVSHCAKRLPCKSGMHPEHSIAAFSQNICICPKFLQLLAGTNAPPPAIFKVQLILDLTK